MQMRSIAEHACIAIAYLAFFPIVTLWSLFRAKKNSSRKEILILSNDLLGDAISRVPFFAALRYEFPPSTHRISIVILSKYAEIYSSMPYFDEIIPVNTTHDRNPIIWLLTGDLNWAIRRRNIDILISCLKANSFWQDFILRTLSPRTSSGPCRNRFIKNPEISRDHRHLSIPRIGHSLIDDFNLALKFIKPNAADIHRLSPAETSFLTLPVEKFNLVHPYIAVVPGAGAQYRQWPIDRFIQTLLPILNSHPSMSLAILGSAKERYLGELIQKSIPHKTQNLCGKTSFKELGGILANAKAVLTNETGSATFAAVLGAPTVCILGGGDFGTYFPNSDFYPNTTSIYIKESCFYCAWNCTRTVLSNLAPCIDSISVKPVTAALHKAINI